MKPGDHIKVNSRHWARSNQIGIIIEVVEDPTRCNNYLVHFDNIGIGLDSHNLWLSDLDMVIYE